ncbi:unnamed protein product [Sphenostylis stenocarpa]|uniref:Uncharacterized protein n=1 Tax=Sphenostylis stenocarpa TaxID=92480 RepID=A0AA86VTL1_9FABA|nr:unnamed protein product [Sphenostylis stenocarpa]
MENRSSLYRLLELSRRSLVYSNSLIPFLCKFNDDYTKELEEACRTRTMVEVP